MGCGALGGQKGGKAFEVDTSVEAPAGSEARREFRKLEEELSWLRKVFEKEKAEKKWIMERYERVESDLIARTQEASQLRAQVDTLRGNGGFQTVDASCASTMQPISVQPMTLQAPSLQMPERGSSPLPERASSPAPVSPGGGSSLKARRGLSLTVQTNSVVKEKPANDVQASAQQAPTLQPLQTQQAPRLQPLSVQTQPQESTHNNGQVGALPARAASPLTIQTNSRNSKKEEFLASLAANTKRAEESELVEPMTAKATLGRSTWGSQFSDDEAPMSPLLRRRRDGDSGGVRNKKDPSRFVTTPGNLCSPTGLSLKTVKFDKLDLVPPSPKRIPPTPGKRKAQQDIEWATPIVEEEENVNSPNR